MTWMYPAVMPARSVRPLAAGRPLAEQVRSRLAEGMAAGEWRPGEAIPSETTLARDFGVAIGTIRKAVDGLVAQQALVRRQGKGTFVAAHDPGRLMFHFFHVVARDGTKSYPEVTTLDFRRDRAGARDAAALGISPLEKVIRIRNVLSLDGHRAILDDIALPAELFPGLTEKIFLARENTIYHLYQARFGINVLRTDERLRATLATREVAQHLGTPEGTALLEIRRVAYTFRDRAVELRLSRVDSGRFEYHNTLGKGEPI